MGKEASVSHLEGYTEYSVYSVEQEMQLTASRKMYLGLSFRSHLNVYVSNV